MKSKFLGLLFISVVVTFLGALTITYAFEGPNGSPPGGTGAPLKKEFGGTEASTFELARTNLGAAAAANNEDITALMSGNIGIGTTTPDDKLDVNGGIIGNQVTSDGGRVIVKDSAANDANTGTNLNSVTIGKDSTTSAGWIQAYGASAQTLQLNPLGGNVGIGTTGPLNNFHIKESSNSELAVQLLLNNEGGGSHGAGLAFQVADDDEYTTYGPKAAIIQERVNTFGRGPLKFFNSNTGTSASFTATDERMRIQPNGNVGIGTTDPNKKLEVRSDNNGGESVIARLANVQFDAGTIATLEFLTGDRTAKIQGIRTGNNEGVDLAFLVDDTLAGNTATERMRITEGGNVGIGTADPQAKLDIFQSGTINTTTPGLGRYGLHLTPQSSAVDTATGITFGAGDSGSGKTAQAGIYSQFSGSYGTKLYFATTDSYGAGAKTRMIIDSVGNVGIGTTNPTTGKLVVSGGNVDVTNNKIINLATPTASTDAATKGYVDANSGGTSWTLVGSSPMNSSGGQYTVINVPDICKSSFCDLRFVQIHNTNGISQMKMFSYKQNSQTSGNNWVVTNSANGGAGLNGNGVYSIIVDLGGPGYLKDDSGSESSEQSSDQWTIDDGRNDYAYEVWALI